MSHPHQAHFPQFVPAPAIVPAPDIPPVPVTRLRQVLAGFDIVIVPGLDGSHPWHWQSRWESCLRRLGLTVHRVEQTDWAQPVYADWAHGLRRALQQARRPVIVVAHSLGAVLTVRMATLEGPAGIAAALLVAPADTDCSEAPDRARIASFAPLPTRPLPFPALVMASRNDEWLSRPRARALATCWGAGMVDAGAIGHIGNHAPIGLWPDGLHALAALARQIPGHGSAGPS